MTTYWLLLIGFGLLQKSVQSPQATQHVPRNGLYRTADEFTHRRITHGFDEGATNCYWKPVKSRCKPTSLQTVDSLLKLDEERYWGVRWQGTDYRIVKGNWYQVVDVDGLVVYELDDAWGMDGGGTTFYFSRSAGSDLHYLTRKELLQTFVDDSSMTAKVKSIRWPYHLLHSSSASRHTKLVDLFHKSRP